jgi:hypothetical protein
MPRDDFEYDGNGGWKEWSQYVKLSIQELKAKAEKAQEDLTSMKVELGMLKTKMAMWGALGATVATVLLQLLFAYLKLKGGAP